MSEVIFRTARRGDVPAIVAMLLDDAVTASREPAEPVGEEIDAAYWAGFEAVRVRSELRGKGIGRRMMHWAVDQARERGCRLVQLTTDKRRTDAHRFYTSLGFGASHEGMKLPI